MLLQISRYDTQERQIRSHVQLATSHKSTRSKIRQLLIMLTAPGYKKFAT